MIESQITPETVTVVAGAALGLYALSMAYSANQRGAIKYRDGRECQMDCENAQHCGGEDDCTQVHHVRPQKWLRDHGFPDREIDSARNGITLCETFHQKEIHGVPQAEVQRRIRMGVPYWNTHHDMRLAEKADENTRKAKRKGWKFPKPNRK